jgi:hypothetical protein
MPVRHTCQVWTRKLPVELRDKYAERVLLCVRHRVQRQSSRTLGGRPSALRLVQQPFQHEDTGMTLYSLMNQNAQLTAVCRTILFSIQVSKPMRPAVACRCVPISSASQTEIWKREQVLTFFVNLNFTP